MPNPENPAIIPEAQRLPRVAIGGFRNPELDGPTSDESRFLGQHRSLFRVIPPGALPALEGTDSMYRTVVVVCVRRPVTDSVECLFSNFAEPDAGEFAGWQVGWDPSSGPQGGFFGTFFTPDGGGGFYQAVVANELGPMPDVGDVLTVTMWTNPGGEGATNINIRARGYIASLGGDEPIGPVGFRGTVSIGDCNFVPFGEVDVFGGRPASDFAVIMAAGSDIFNAGAGPSSAQVLAYDADILQRLELGENFVGMVDGSGTAVAQFLWDARDADWADGSLPSRVGSLTLFTPEDVRPESFHVSPHLINHDLILKRP